MQQLVLELGLPAPPPAVWETLTPDEREVTVAALTRLIAKALVDDEAPPEEVADD
ncbi:MAG: hypothetical protein ACP5VP_12050 [Candidatus Limnocylindrales bacterium]